MVELGIPTFNEAILADLNRRHSVPEFLQCFEALRAEGIQVAMQIMTGLPGETMDDIRKTADEVCRLNPAYLRIYPLLVLRDTPLQKIYEEGRFTPLSLDEAVARTLYIYLRARRREIPVVRMGLSENEVLKERILAGPYHPSFGYVVKSEAFYLALKGKLLGAGMTGEVRVTLDKRDIPHLVGHGKSNIRRFKEEGILIAWETGDLAVGSFSASSGCARTEGTVFDALQVFTGP